MSHDQKHNYWLTTETGLPIGEVAARTGFRDANYFARAIRRATGSSPRAFRGA